MGFSVTKVFDGDTFEVSPYWQWNGQTGNVVSPAGYDTPEQGHIGHDAAKHELARLILGRNVELNNAVAISYGRLVCDVFIDGVNLARCFPQYAA